MPESFIRCNFTDLGRLVSIEGLNGVGKTYLTTRVIKAIADRGGQAPHVIEDFSSRTVPNLARHGTKTILDYGCGIGSDTLRLHQNGFNVVGCDFHSPSTAFLHWRSHDTIPVIEPNELDSRTAPDTLWIIDTLDHLVNIETSLATLLSVVDRMVTENLTTNHGHGRQRFHIRRQHLRFSRADLDGIVAAAGTGVGHAPSTASHPVARSRHR